MEYEPLIYVHKGENMNISNINSENVIFSLDIGTRSIKGTVGIVRDKKFYVVAENYEEHKERAMLDGQIHDIDLVAYAVKKVKDNLEKELGFTLEKVAIAAAGRFLRTVETSGEMELEVEKEMDKQLVRSLELTAVKEAESIIGKNTEGKLYCVGYSVKNYFLNGYVISNLLGHKGENVKVEVIATFLPKSVVDSLYSVMDKVALKVVNLTLEPIAAMEAIIPKNLRLLNLALVDIGAGTSDIAICNKESITAYGMVPQAGDEITEVIAQGLLVDFNTADEIKRQTEKEEIIYTDVLGFENKISSKDLLKIVEPTVEKISKEIATKIIELNGGKAPSAVFLVGGGAHTPFLKEKIAEKLSITNQRIAIKGREGVTDCVCTDNSLGSIGVTVLGIALVAIKSLGNDFIDVTLNGTEISLFNSHKNNVMDVLLQGGINPKILIAKNGKSIRYTLNGVKRVSFGELGENAKILINSQEANLETKVKAGDNIEIIYAKPGQDASPKVFELIKNYEEFSFYLDDNLINVEPIVYINDERSSLDTTIKDGDKIEIITSKSVGHIKNFILKSNEDLYLNGKLLKDDYEISLGDRLKKKGKKDSNLLEKTIEENIIKVIVNGKQLELKGRKSYVFVDVFNYYDFDLSVPKGHINLMLNGKNASYTDIIKDGDNIEIFWS
jgi:cell division protein FtsA